MARYSPLVLALDLLAAVCLTACAGGDPPKREVLLTTQPGAAVLLPMNVAVPLPTQFEAASPQVWQQLRQYLESHEFELKTLSQASANELWKQSATAAQAESSRAEFADAARHFARLLQRYSEFRVVVWPSLFIQGARLTGRTAEWDGTSQTVAVDEGSWQGRLDPESPFEGVVPAASIHMVVLDRSGVVRQENKVGLMLLAGVAIQGNPILNELEYEIEPLPDAWQDEDRVRAGIIRALEPYLVAPTGEDSDLSAAPGR